MSNLTPEDVDLRLTSVHSLLDEEDMRLWEGLEDEKISRIAGDEANKQFTAQVQTANQGTESRLSTEVIHRSEGDINNIEQLEKNLLDARLNTEKICAGWLILGKKENLINSNFRLRMAQMQNLLSLDQFKNEDQIFDSAEDAINSHAKI